MRESTGLTLVETIIAMTVCAIVLGGLATMTTTSLLESRTGNHKIQAVQILDTIGRRIAGGEESLLPGSGETVELDAGSVAAITGIESAAAVNYEVAIENLGLMEVGTSQLVQYRIDVCYGAGDARRCIAARTLGR